MHAVVVMGTIASIPTTPPSNLEQVPAALRIQALLYLAVAAGVIESPVVHCTHARCGCYMKGMDGESTVAATGLEFLAKVMHLVPVVLASFFLRIFVVHHQISLDMGHTSYIDWYFHVPCSER